MAERKWNWRTWFALPVFYLAVLTLLWCIFAFVLLPLYKNPGYLYSLLSPGGYDVWVEFVQQDMDYVLLSSSNIFALLSLGFAFAVLIVTRWRVKKRGEWTALFLVLFCVWIGFGMSIPQGRWSRARAGCRSHLKQMYLELMQYAADWDGSLPPDLRTLKNVYVNDSAVFRCPARTLPNREFSDYLYFGAGRKLDETPFLLLRDRDENHPGNLCHSLDSDGTIKESSSDRGI